MAIVAAALFACVRPWAQQVSVRAALWALSQFYRLNLSHINKSPKFGYDFSYSCFCSL